MTYLLAEIDWGSLISSHNAIPIAGIVIGIVVPVVAISFASWTKVRNHEQNVRLKRDLVAKGYSADEIEKILSIKSPK
ncbi:MAG: hypothetical protein Kow00105_14370 [Phycisphaeraceae bacterium]